MSFTTLSIRVEVAKKLKAAKVRGESYSDTLERLLENQPAKSVGEWLDALRPLEGTALFSASARRSLRNDQRRPRRSLRKIRVRT